ncbi:glycosyltransferase family 2 protein [Alkalibacterium olivapovliticus]|uniref:Glycosyltransferase involved in cell wall biosynthesis n=1 Tax=Alkalibacterium olivapovliticus TaxID=99907 RepID=A0A2T0W7P8_9LACT|nr:glycosyltransferase [Alkalibacterium olivapovliticus]PRY82712.1 glycosyltransferase involved in cell wall biosynthesis [Alkalibacterium olivapovliticus]
MFDVSIIMPVYNVKEHLPRAIESALAQKKVIGEIILVNDGSTDGSKDVCEAYAEKEPLLITVINQENQGSGPARNAGLKAASGKFIYFADPDDYFNERLLADNIALAKKRETDLVVFGYTQEKAGNPASREMRLPNLPQMDTQKAFREHFRNMYHFSPYALWNKMYRKAFLTKHNITFGSQKQGQDALFNIEVYKHLDSLTVNRKPYYHYVTHEGSAVNRYRADRFKLELAIAQSFENLMETWEEEDTFSDLIAEEYFNVVYLETANLVHPDCPFTTDEKIDRLTSLWTEIGQTKISPYKKEEKNPFRFALLYELKAGHSRNALFLMKTRNQAAKQYTKPFTKIKTFFNN